MLRRFLLSKIHRATITGAHVDYVGSLTLDPDLMTAAGILPNEAVDIYNVRNGHRLTTYVLTGRPGSGEVVANGAAALLLHPGDVVIIATYVLLDEREWERHEPTVVFVDEANRVTSVVRKRG